MFAIRKTMVAGLALAAAAGLTTIATAPASAGTATITFSCGTYLGRPWTADYTITITAPATAARGQSVTVSAVIEYVAPLTKDTPANTVSTYLEVPLGGAASGTLYVGQLKNPALHAGDHLRLEGGTASTTFSTAGDVTYTPFRFVTSYGYGCAVVGGPVVATTHVS